MGFRTVVIRSRCKLESSLNYLVYRTAECEKKILLDEISIIIVETGMASITSSLLATLSERNIKVIFCDTKCNPISELLPYHGGFDSLAKITKQFTFSEKHRNKVWKEIVKRKILNESKVLKSLKLDCSIKLDEYFEAVEDGDVTNREGHAAKVYFNALFGKDFNRSQENDINKFLDYGYTILLSAINRAITGLGYYTEIGIHHIGRTNPFNLSCDLIEPLRPLVDKMIVQGNVSNENFKDQFVKMLDDYVVIENQNMHLENALKIYIQSCLIALENGDCSKIKWITYAI